MVPSGSLISYPGQRIQERPKSTIFGIASSSLLLIIMFWGFMSLWTIPNV